MNTPTPTPTVTLTLTENDTRYVLEALQMLEDKWIRINRTTTDEDEQADYGMDAIDLHGTREFIQHEALGAFGQSVINFSHESLPSTDISDGGHPEAA